ncbi:MAG: OadG family protein [Helicobacteraceae bacterium]|jgi:sodium pump decarboxylase gamma subunit|nr:OadG family protein [Helicobacteraceae bacterium]
MDVIWSATKVMIVGMTTVFVFLTFMILFLKAQGAVLTRYFPQKPAAASAGAKGKLQGDSLQKVILAAIAEYKKRRSA